MTRNRHGTVITEHVSVTRSVRREFVYAYQITPDGPIKIGLSSNPRKRMETGQVECPWALQLLGCTPGDWQLEREIQARFAAHQLRAQWFRPHAEVLGWCASSRPGARRPTVRRDRP